MLEVADLFPPVKKRSQNKKSEFKRPFFRRSRDIAAGSK